MVLKRLDSAWAEVVLSTELGLLVCARRCSFFVGELMQDLGLIALAAARASGAHPIVITDVEPKRLDFAKDFVPSCQTYLVDQSLDASGNAAGVRKLFGVKEGNEYSAPTVVLECTGIESSVCTAAYVARRGGCVMVIGVGRSIMNNLPFMHLSLAEVS